MKILLVGGLSMDEEEVASLWLLDEYMQQEFAEYEVHTAYLDDILYTLSPRGLDATITSLARSVDVYDIVYIRGPKMRLRSEQAYYLSRYCANKGIRCLNDYSLYYPGTKVAQTMIFYEERAPFLDTLYTLSNMALIEAAEHKFGYPYILKTTSGSHGEANYLVRSREEAETAVRDDVGVDFLAQQFCENDRDYRVLVTPDTALTFARKGASDTHLNNTSRGAQAVLAEDGEVPDFLIDVARRVADRLHLELAGVDIMPRLDSDEYYFLEVNSQPQFRTGAFLPEKAALLRSLFER